MAPHDANTAQNTLPGGLGAWEDLVAVVFDAGTCSITLESEEGYTATVPCDDLLELRRLAAFTFALAEGHDVRLEWRIPVADRP